MTFPERPRRGLNLETIAVVIIICAAAGYLVRRYLKKGRNVGECACDNMECPLIGSGPAPIKNGCHEMVCEGKICSDDPQDDRIMR